MQGRNTLTDVMLVAILASMKPKPIASPRKEITTDMQRLRFLVRFAQIELETLRAGDWLNLQEELRDCLLPLKESFHPGGLYVVPTDPPLPEEYSRADFRKLQGEIREILTMVIDSRADNRIWRRIPIHVRLAAPQVPWPKDGQRGRHILLAQGTVRDVVLLVLWTLLGKTNTAHLVRCPECETIFFQRTNQDYCSRTCVNRVSQRRWRERQETAATASLVSDVVH